MSKTAFYSSFCLHFLRLHSLGGAGDAIILAKRMEMSREGKDTCADMDEECKVEEWI